MDKSSIIIEEKNENDDENGTFYNEYVTKNNIYN